MPKNPNWSQKEIDILKSYYKNIPCKELSTILDRSVSAIITRAIKLGLSKKRNKNRIGNPDFFNKITNLSCYYAGFIAADGCIKDYNGYYRLAVQITEKDKIILENFAKSIKLDGNLYYHGSRKSTNGYTTKPSYSIEVWDKNIINGLMYNFNIKPRKSLTLESPNDEKWTLNNKLSFIAGLIDGDGSIICCFKNKRAKELNTKRLYLNVLGTYNMLLFVQKVFCESIYKKIFNIKQNKNISILNMSSYDAFIFLNKIRKINIPLLNRKWSKIDEYVENRKIKGLPTFN